MALPGQPNNRSAWKLKPPVEAWVEWRARRIDDPVERLRYLMERHRPVRQGGPRKRRAGAFCMLLIPLLWIVPVHESRSAASKPVPSEESIATNSLKQMMLLSQRDSPIPEVWLVERKPGEEVYSNGLRIETAATVGHLPRAYASISLQTGKLRTDGVQPAGIIYHTTESHIAAFEADNNPRLQSVGQWALQYLTKNKSYHYLIDRFGRVHRVVAEEDSADHAGSSIWADRERVYLGLNHSFLGVAVEGQTMPGDAPAQSLTSAQIHATRVLTDMLRSRHQIPAGNCITHAQASVNRRNLRIGNHTDWGANFPFQSIGLPDNYNLPVPAMILFGFGYDQDFVLATGERFWKGLAISENQVRLAAGSSGLTVPVYRAKLQEEFRRRLAELPDSQDTGQPLARAARHRFGIRN